MGRLSPVIIEPVWSIVALFLDPVQERLSLRTLKRTSVRKNAVLIVTDTYQRWDLQNSDYPIKNSKQILMQSNIKKIIIPIVFNQVKIVEKNYSHVILRDYWKIERFGSESHAKYIFFLKVHKRDVTTYLLQEEVRISRNKILFFLLRVITRYRKL